MKKLITLIIALSTVFYITSISMADTTTFNAQIVILSSATVTENQGLTFPNTAIPGSGTTNVVVDASDSGAGVYDISSAANTLVDISLASDIITLTRVSGTETIDISTFTIDVGAGSTAWGAPTTASVGTTDGSGDLQIRIGATAAVESTVVDGTYTGTSVLTVLNQ